MPVRTAVWQYVLMDKWSVHAVSPGLD